MTRASRPARIQGQREGASSFSAGSACWRQRPGGRSGRDRHPDAGHHPGGVRRRDRRHEPGLGASRSAAANSVPLA